MLQVTRFTASWCQPCKVIAPYFDEFRQKYSSANFNTIDIDINKEAAMSKGVRSIPTVIIEKDGQEIKRFVGINAKHAYASVIESNL